MAFTAVTLASCSLARQHIDHLVNWIDIGHLNIAFRVCIRMVRVKLEATWRIILMDVRNFGTVRLIMKRIAKNLIE